MKFHTIALAALTMVSLFAGHAQSQQYPTRPVKILVTIPPGGAPDIAARLLAQRLSETMGQSFFIENRSGANGNVAAEMTARAEPDGYTLIMAADSLITVNPHVYASMPIDMLKDLLPVASVASNQFFLSVNPNVPVKTLPELVEYARKQKPPLAYASGGNGTPPHLSMAIFTEKTGIQMVHVPYKGSGPALVDVMAGQITMIIDTAASATPHVRSGKMRGIAITGKRRWPDLPDVPTFAESGLPDYDSSSWYAIHAPAGTPKAIVAKLSGELARIVKLPDVSEKLRLMSAEAVGSTPEQLDAFVKSEADKWGKVIKSLNLRVD